MGRRQRREHGRTEWQPQGEGSVWDGEGAGVLRPSVLAFSRPVRGCRAAGLTAHSLGRVGRVGRGARVTEARAAGTAAATSRPGRPGGAG